MGAVGFGYANGWAGALYGIGGAIGILLLALWFAPVRKMNFMTMSEELAYYVGANRIVKNLVGILIFVASIGWLGAHILGGGMYLAWIADIDLTLLRSSLQQPLPSMLLSVVTQQLFGLTPFKLSSFSLASS